MCQVLWADCLSIETLSQHRIPYESKLSKKTLDQLTTFLKNDKNIVERLEQLTPSLGIIANYQSNSGLRNVSDTTEYTRAYQEIYRQMLEAGLSTSLSTRLLADLGPKIPFTLKPVFTTYAKYRDFIRLFTKVGYSEAVAKIIALTAAGMIASPVSILSLPTYLVLSPAYATGITAIASVTQLDAALFVGFMYFGKPGVDFIRELGSQFLLNISPVTEKLNLVYAKSLDATLWQEKIVNLIPTSWSFSKQLVAATLVLAISFTPIKNDEAIHLNATFAKLIPHIEKIDSSITPLLSDP